jgi:predicted nucleic-acid-binding protein
VKITADTNLLIRAIVEDDAREARLARDELANAERIVLTLPALCELVWVLSSLYRTPRSAIAAAVRSLVDADNAIADLPAIEAGLAHLEGGGDFADGVIAHDGRRLGGEQFVSFDRTAVRLVQAQGEPAQRLV